MVTLIYGGSGSGKSEFAEDYVCSFENLKRYYLATMMAGDSESVKRIEKHRKARAGKDFETVEMPVDVALFTPNHNSIVLLECLSNLVANEMFRDGEIINSQDCINKITKDILSLQEKTRHLVIVSNDIFDDGMEYDDTTKYYLRALGEINVFLSQMASEVYEVVVGIPIKIKGNK